MLGRSWWSVVLCSGVILLVHVAWGVDERVTGRSHAMWLPISLMVYAAAGFMAGQQEHGWFYGALGGFVVGVANVVGGVALALIADWELSGWNLTEVLIAVLLVSHLGTVTGLLAGLVGDWWAKRRGPPARGNADG